MGPTYNRTVVPSVEGAVERFCRRGGDLVALRRQAPPRPTVDQIIAASSQTLCTPYGEQDGNGVDLTMIRENLRRSVTERIRSADSARRDFLRMRDHVGAAGA